MKKFKRIFALTGAILLILLYVSTLVFAFIDHPASMGLLKAAVACTILLPVLLYAYALVYKATRKEDEDTETENYRCASVLNIKFCQYPGRTFFMRFYYSFLLF